MPDNKQISQLPELLSPSASDILPIVNAAATKRITFDNLTKALAEQSMLNALLFG